MDEGLLEEFIRQYMGSQDNFTVFFTWQGGGDVWRGYVGLVCRAAGSYFGGFGLNIGISG